MKNTLHNGHQLSVVMISLNEERAIKKVISAVQAAHPLAEIVVVDSSTDQTAEIAASMGAKVIKQFPPKGYGLAMDAALKSASRDVIVTLDCDDTYPISAITALLEKMQAGYDVVSASRLQRRPKSMPLSNFLANRFFVWCGKVISAAHSTDLHTGMRAYRNTLIQQFPYEPTQSALPVELQVGPMVMGYRCAEIFIDYHERVGDSKLDKIQSTVCTIKRLWRWRWFFNSRLKQAIRRTHF